MSKTKQSIFNLLSFGQDSYSGANAQNPKTARKLQSWIPSDDGELHRELPEPTYVPTTLSGPQVGLYSFAQIVDGVITRFFFCAARTNFTVGTKTCNFYQNVSNVWTLVSAVGILADAPMCVTQQDNFYLSDGENNWLFDGTDWVMVGLAIPLNEPAINIDNGTPTILFNGSVTAYFYGHNSSFAGAVDLNFPTTTGSALATATGNSILFNPPQFNGTSDPNQQPMQWATLNSSGVITGYTTPYSGATQNYTMSVITKLVIPAPGNYTIAMNHDDGAFFGFGPGETNAGVPTILGGPFINIWQSKTAINGYPILGGTNKSGNWNDSFVVSFPSADTYDLEINYCQWENEQQLVFLVNGSTPLPTTSANPGEINASIGRYYWFSNADQTKGRATESSTSPIGQLTGPLVGAQISVYQQPGLFTSSSSNKIISGSNSSDSPGPIAPDLDATMVGKVIYINGTLIGTIAGVSGGGTFTLSAASANDGNGHTTYTGTITGGAGNAFVGILFTVSGFSNSNNNGSDFVCTASTATTLTLSNAVGTAETHSGSATSPANTILLEANGAATISSGRAVICDARATHWNVYASESDGSKIGQQLASVPVTQNLDSDPFIDSSPFIDDANNSFLPIYRPLRNDPPPPSILLEVHKVRQWRRREANPNFFNFTANEEVTSGDNGDPTQCVPGADVNTVSDMVNEISYPDQSVRLRALTSHMDSLYMFSEKQCYPLYGNSVDDFAIGQTVAFAQGAAGRFAAKSTTHGLIFVSYDRRGFLYPSSLYSSYLSQAGVASTALQEIGKPMRNVLATIDPSRLDEVVTEWYHVGIRDWWVICFPDKNGDYQTYVYDFNSRGWFQLQRGFASVAMFEITEGIFVLLGGGSDGNTYVVDDQSGTFSTSGTCPQAIFRPALINFGDDSNAHVFRSLELEFGSLAMQQDITITYWLDPNNVDNPGTGRTLSLKPILGANRYIAYPHRDATCQRMLLEVNAKASTNAGVIRGMKLVADTVDWPVPSNQNVNVGGGL